MSASFGTNNGRTLVYRRIGNAPRLAPEYTDAINAVWDASADPRVAEARRAREQRLEIRARTPVVTGDHDFFAAPERFRQEVAGCLEA